MPMNKTTKNFLDLLLRVSLSGICLWYVFTIVDVEKTKNALQSADMRYIAVGGVILCVIVFVMLIRWFVFIKALDLSVKARDVTRCYFIGLFGNLFLPSAIGGDLLKVVGLCKDSSQKTACCRFSFA